MIRKLQGKIPDSVFVQLNNEFYLGLSKLRLAHFLAQCDHESAGFTRTTENLNYSTKALRNTFKKYFDEKTIAAYAHRPKMIGARVYANRMGNGNEASGEGFLYRGRGYLQTTGKHVYEELGAFLQVDLVGNPDLVATTYALESARFFFDRHNVWAICDKGAADSDVEAVTRVVNGGINGLVERQVAFDKYWALLK